MSVKNPVTPFTKELWPLATQFGKKHDFLHDNHSTNEKRTTAVIIICALSMVIEITCGILFGSLALVADGLHMSTHVIAFTISAAAYNYARRHRNDPRFVFGTGKVGELAAYTSALILLGIALYIVYDGIDRLIYPTTLDYIQALPVAFVGLSVNIISGMLLGMSFEKKKNTNGKDDVEEEKYQLAINHGHSHGHVQERYEFDELDDGDDEHEDHDEIFQVQCTHGNIVLSIFEDGIPPVFRVDFENWQGFPPASEYVTVDTIRPNNTIQTFHFSPRILEGIVKNSFHLQSTIEIPEPHEFKVILRIHGPEEEMIHGRGEYEFEFIEHDHNHGHEHGHGRKSSDNYHNDDVDFRSHGHDHSAILASQGTNRSGGDHDESFDIMTPSGIITLSIFEDGIPPVFRVHFQKNWRGAKLSPSLISVKTIRSSAFINTFQFESKTENGVTFLQSTTSIPEPHEFRTVLSVDDEEYSVEFVESEDHSHAHGHGHVDNNDNHDNHDSNCHEICDEHDHDHSRNQERGHGQECSHDHDHSHELGHDHDIEHGHEHEHDHEHDSHSSNHVELSIPSVYPKSDAYAAIPIAKSSHTVPSVSSKVKKEKFQRDNNFRAAVIHVAADGFVSVLVIIAIVIAGNVPGTVFLDPAVAIIGALVIVSWAVQLMLDTSTNLLDMSPDVNLFNNLKKLLEKDGTTVIDLHVWRVGPGHLASVMSLLPPTPLKEAMISKEKNNLARNDAYYRRKIRGFKALSHVTIEICEPLMR